MTSLYKKQFGIVKKNLNIENIISIRFSNKKNKIFKKYNDTACTALARSLKNNIFTYIDRKNGQLCFGGNYFLNIIHPSKKEICDIYVKDEKVFQNNNVSSNFLNDLPKYPVSANKRYILFTPLIKEKNKPDVIFFLVKPAQASRILGLSVYKKMSFPLVMPALPTCASIYAPIESGKIHLNFIDYYDRYFQGKQKERLIWSENSLIISLPYNLFKKIVEYIPLSAHGSFKPKIKPQKFDTI